MTRLTERSRRQTDLATRTTFQTGSRIASGRHRAHESAERVVLQFFERAIEEPAVHEATDVHGPGQITGAAQKCDGLADGRRRRAPVRAPGANADVCGSDGLEVAVAIEQRMSGLHQRLDR